MKPYNKSKTKIFEASQEMKRAIKSRCNASRARLRIQALEEQEEEKKRKKKEKKRLDVAEFRVMKEKKRQILLLRGSK